MNSLGFRVLKNGSVLGIDEALLKNVLIVSHDLIYANDGYEIDMLSGFKDKNGEEIYMSDILIDRDCSEYKISYLNGTLYLRRPFKFANGVGKIAVVI